MGIDAVALLRISGFRAPKTAHGTEFFVEHRGDCSLHHTMIRFHELAPDEHALALRRTIGDALDAHVDPRGILFFPDACEPKGSGYEAIIGQLGKAGVWAPKVGENHVPDRITKAQPGTYDDLLKRAMEKRGVAGHDAVEEAYLLFRLTRPLAVRADMGDDYGACLTKLAESMGRAFVTDLEVVFEARLAAELARQDARFAQLNKGGGALFRNDRERATVQAFTEGLKTEIAHAIGELDLDAGNQSVDDLLKQAAKNLDIKMKMAPHPSPAGVAASKKPAAPAKTAAPQKTAAPKKTAAKKPPTAKKKGSRRS